MKTKQHNLARVRRSPGGRAFTLLEMVVAVGAVALISVGLAAIFQAVGKTVTGGKRLSLLTNYSTLLESRLRADISAMTRRGPLVIRQQWVDVNNNGDVDPKNGASNSSPDDVALSANGVNQATGELKSRQRRVDELLFFAQGSFTSSRQSPLPGAIATSNEARIYYGHGQRLSDDTEPEVNELNDGGPDLILGRGPDSSPNHFASNWTLLRHEMLLLKPEAAPQPGVGDGVIVQGLNSNTGRLANKATQILLLPAASSVFRSVSAIYPDLSGSYSGVFPRDNPKLVYRDNLNGSTSAYPLASSGIIDIATTNLDEVRAVILGNTKNNSNVPTLPQTVRQLRKVVPLNFAIAYTDPASPATRPAAVTGATSLDVMHAWMADLFPTQSQMSGDIIYPSNLAADPQGVRMRYEPFAVGLDGVMRDSASLGGPTQQRELQEEKTDRETIAANNLLPRCTEFKVEWTFGDPDPDPAREGQLVWFGPRDPDRESPAAYPWTPSAVTSQSVVKKIPLTQRQNAMTHDIPARLIYGYAPAPLDNPACLTSYFGFIDPTYTQVAATDPKSIAWEWPKLIRVTVSVADQNDPSFEAQFQYVFAVPDDSRTQ